MFDLTSIISSLDNRLFFQGKQGDSPLVDSGSPPKSNSAANGEAVIVSLSASSQNYYYESRVQAPAAVANVETPQNKSPEQTAQNILGAIRQKLSLAKSAGADQKEIGALLQEANRGFKKGFREASKQLDYSGALDNRLEAELQETKKLVARGLKDLQHEFEGAKHPGPASDKTPTTFDSNTNPAADEQATESVTVIDKKNVASIAGDGSASIDHNARISTQVSLLEQTNFSQSFALANRSTHSALQGLASSFSGAYSRTQSAFIEISTRDGDVITIDLAAAIEASKSFNRNSDFEISISAQNSGRFLIEGVLDEDEVSALNDLLVQVESLAGKFFGGDVSAAFQQAQSMGFDTDEIAGFSLDFSQSTSIEASVAYLENAGANAAAEQVQKQSGFSALADYASSLHRALDTAGQFSQSANLLSALLSTTIELVVDVPRIENIEAFNTVNDQLIEGIENL